MAHKVEHLIQRASAQVDHLFSDTDLKLGDVCRPASHRLRNLFHRNLHLVHLIASDPDVILRLIDDNTEHTVRLHNGIVRICIHRRQAAGCIDIIELLHIRVHRDHGRLRRTCHQPACSRICLLKADRCADPKQNLRPFPVVDLRRNPKLNIRRCIRRDNLIFRHILIAAVLLCHAAQLQHISSLLDPFDIDAVRLVGLD